MNPLLARPVMTKLWAKQDGRCFYCLDPMDAEPCISGVPEKGWTRDHFVPLALLTGTHNVHNIVLAHAACNHDKASRLPTTVEVERFGATFGRQAMNVLRQNLENAHRNLTETERRVRALLGFSTPAREGIPQGD